MGNHADVLRQPARLLRLLVLYALAALLRLHASLVSLAKPASTTTSLTAPQRILVIKPDHLGDVLLVTPALHTLRQQHPQAQTTALVGPWSAVILEHNPDIDALRTFPFPGFERGTSASAARGIPRVIVPYLTLLRYALLLRRSHFDRALLLRDDHWWGAALAALAGIPERWGYAVPECRPLLTRALPWNPREHVTVQALEVVMGQQADSHQQAWQSWSLHFAPSPADSAWLDAWLAQHHITPSEPFAALHAGTGGAAKLWLPERWAQVANTLMAEMGMRMVLTGGPGEAALVAAITRHMQHTPLVLVGATSVGQLAALFGRAALVLGVDSGPLHLAVSQGTPTLHLYGPGDDGRFGPWGNPALHRVVRTNLWCSPCGVFRACPRGTDPPECMAGVTVAQVMTACHQLLQREAQT